MRNNLLVFTSLLFIALFVWLNNFSNHVGYSVGNLHTHTTCSDGENSYEENIEMAIKLKFDFIAMTDHEFCPEIINKCQKEERILCIPGQEVTTPRTHLVALNISSEIYNKLTLKKQVEEIHRQGGIAVASHPHLEPFKYTKDELTKSGIDAMECSYEEKEDRPLPCVYDSDAHKAINLNYQATQCPKIKNLDDLRTAILENKCTRANTFSNFLIKYIPKKLLM